MLDYNQAMNRFGGNMTALRNATARTYRSRGIFGGTEWDAYLGGGGAFDRINEDFSALANALREIMANQRRLPFSPDPFAAANQMRDLDLMMAGMGGLKSKGKLWKHLGL